MNEIHVPKSTQLCHIKPIPLVEVLVLRNNSFRLLYTLTRANFEEQVGDSNACFLQNY